MSRSRKVWSSVEAQENRLVCFMRVSRKENQRTHTNEFVYACKHAYVHVRASLPVHFRVLRECL